jgi:outer membrane protein assembly factor BamB
MGLVLLSSCGKAPRQSTDVKIIKPSSMPETKRVENIDGKGLEEYATLDVKPEVFFETKSKIRSAISVNDGKLYFGNENCEFYAVDVATKQKSWMYSTDVPVQTWPAFSDGKILFNAGNSLYVLDAMDGKEIHKVAYPTKSSFRLSQEGFAFNDSYVAVSDGIAYYAALNGDIVAVDIMKGELTWVHTSETPGTVASGLNYWNGKLYYTDFAGSLCCVDIQTRQLLFQTQIQDRIFAQMYINDGKIYAGGRSCKMYCIDAESGDVIWSSFSHDTTTWLSGGSVSVGNTLYACTSDEHTIVAFNKDTGEFLRLYPTETNAYTAPLLHGENVIVAATDVYSFKKSHIMEFDTKNHFKLWQISLDDCVLSSPAIYQGVLYFGTDSGTIYNLPLNVN